MEFRSKDGIIFHGDKSYVVSRIDKEGIQNIKVVIEDNNLKNKLSELPIIRYYCGSNISIIINLILFFVCMVMDFYYKGNAIFGICIYIKILISILILFCFPQSERILEFYGAEHKAINTYNLYKEVSIENIKKSSRIARGCGTNWGLMYLFVSIVITIISRKFYMAIMFINYGFTRELFMVNDIENNPFFFLVFKAGDYLQDKFLTKEPLDEQLDLAKNAINQ